MRNTHLGIIGGGQLGMLLVQAAIEMPAKVSVYDPNPECSARYFTHNYVQGDFDDYDKLLEFGMECDALIFENEHINIEALLKLEKQGKRIVSSPHTLKWIQDKGTQREMLAKHGFPMPEFFLIDGADVQDYDGKLPLVQKWRTGGYDGYGVNILRTPEDVNNADQKDSIFEDLIDIKTEVSVLIARDEQGNVKVYPPIEMVFNETNKVDYLLAPANISKEVEAELINLSKEIATKCEFIGIYAIEFFVDQNDQVFVNEIAPRPHNSGHHTIAANVTSQYEQQIRIALGLPLGSVDMLTPCLLLNLLADNSSGPANYEGLEEALAIPNVHYSFYGKAEVRPGRKMGHAVIFEETMEDALQKIDHIRNTLTITSYEQ